MRKPCSTRSLPLRSAVMVSRTVVELLTVCRKRGDSKRSGGTSGFSMSSTMTKKSGDWSERVAGFLSSAIFLWTMSTTHGTKRSPNMITTDRTCT